MGDIAEQLVDQEMFGRNDQYSGRYYGKVYLPQNVRKKHNSNYTGIYHYLQAGAKATNYVIRIYVLKHLGLDFEYSQIGKMADEIQKDFGAFVSWHKNLKDTPIEDLKKLDTIIRTSFKKRK